MLTHVFTFNIVLMSTDVLVILTNYIKVVLWMGLFCFPVVPSFLSSDFLPYWPLVSINVSVWETNTVQDSVKIETVSVLRERVPTQSFNKQQLKRIIQSSRAKTDTLSVKGWFCHIISIDLTFTFLFICFGLKSNWRTESWSSRK